MNPETRATKRLQSYDTVHLHTVVIVSVKAVNAQHVYMFLAIPGY